MGTKDTDIVEEDAMDKLLYIIRDLLPKEVVTDLHKYLGNIKSLKSVTDMRAFLVVEFYTNIDADAARAKGFEFVHNGQNQKIDYASAGIVAVYMAEACKTLGTGF